MADLTKAASIYRKAQAAAEKATVELARAITEDGWVARHRHISDGRVVSIVFQRVGEDDS